MTVMRKAIEVLYHLVGGVAWPWMAGYFMGMEETPATACIAVTFLGCSFVLWWRIFSWLRRPATHR